MMPGKIRTAQSVSLDTPASEQPYLHNRWHPDIPSVASVKPGETVKIECLDWTGGQIGNNDSADDVRDVDLSRIHYLTGPFDVEGSAPGDLLVVHITDVQPFADAPWGFTGIFARDNGGGFLDAHYPRAAKAVWDLDGIYCTSRHIPGVRFAGLVHPGILGCAPSPDVLAEWNRREAELIAAHPGHLVALPPLETNAHAGRAHGELRARVAREGARTVPGRPEHGGNVDINNISRGSTTYLPVHVPGAKFSVGDLHFSQGDGEISFCGAIEMAGVITIRFDLIKNGMTERAIKSPVYRPGDVAQLFGPSRCLTFEGFSVDESGKQHFLDATVAYRQACLRAIEYLKQFGFLFSGAYTDTNEPSLIAKRRIADLAQFPDAPSISKIPHWLSSQKGDGTWSDVNYLSGCPAQRANWPIQQHWNRLVTLAAAWSGANPSIPKNWTHSHELLAAISKGLDYWFDNDYTPADCMGDGGRAHDLRDGKYGTGGYMTGANAVLLMQNSVSLALYTNNATMLQDAYSRAMKFADMPMQDGIHRDGTFLQHSGILYNGNYGKDLFNAFIQLEGEAIGTSFAAGNATRDAVAAQAKGNEWMIFTDSHTGQEHWDFNAIGRFVAFPAADLQANADINFNVTKLAAATADFTGANDVGDTVRRLKSNGTEKLVGNKGFWAGDYMASQLRHASHGSNISQVHRRRSFILANKMLSTRSASSEYVNSANPYGYHLGQGTLFSYVEGNEYKDIMGAWDWNLVPGTTTLLNAPKLASSNVGQVGKRDFVGVVSDGKVGAAVQDYVDPLGGISYQKASFFLDDSVLVTTTNIKKNASAGEAPAITVLDNRAAASGHIWVDGKQVDAANGLATEGAALFYGGNGYLSYGDPFALTLFEGKRTGNWTQISTSTGGETTVSIFSAYATMAKQTFSYSMFPASSRKRLAEETKQPTWTPITEDGITGAAGSGRLSLVFWPGGGKSITVDLEKIGWEGSGSVTVTSDQPAAFLFAPRRSAGEGMGLVITMSDPTQKAASASFALAFEGGEARQINTERDESAAEGSVLALLLRRALLVNPRYFHIPKPRPRRPALLAAINAIFYPRLADGSP
ncbi:Chondroitinase-AC [Tolypocladium paradoxum]|uniref:Chondroitinase-AC n=1 Tax=Tolypocladium paradoxum TaxID=94208 RepID=A0A2S4KML4_9HYPO|nr:Chondroitinase-AC [Tolypocladium paradoxum]